MLYTTVYVQVGERYVKDKNKLILNMLKYQWAKCNESAAVFCNMIYKLNLFSLHCKLPSLPF